MSQTKLTVELPTTIVKKVQAVAALSDASTAQVIYDALILYVALHQCMRQGSRLQVWHSRDQTYDEFKVVPQTLTR